MKEIWLSPQILDWHLFIDSATIKPAKDWKRSYEIWQHAEDTLQSFSDDFHRVDAITTLKRVVEQRTNLLQRYYSFDEIPLPSRPKRTLELLAYLNVVKPVMLRSLIDVRNAVEHEDKSPPNLLRCAELSEMVWYFLRSTDRLCVSIPSGFYLAESEDEPDDKYGVSINTGPEHNWTIEIGAAIDDLSLISETQKKDWIRVNAENFERRTMTGFRDEDIRSWEYVRFNGRVSGPELHSRRLIELYLSNVAISILPTSDLG